MPSQKQTTVVLTETAQIIKEDLAPLFGLKNILSAGLLVFGKLSSDEQKQAIVQANSNAFGAHVKVAYQEAIAMIKQSIKFEIQEPGSITKILSKEDAAAFEEFRRLIGPDGEQPKKKQKARG